MVMLKSRFDKLVRDHMREVAEETATDKIERAKEYASSYATSMVAALFGKDDD